MHIDEEHGDHGVEVPHAAHAQPLSRGTRRSLATIGVTICLALGGIAVAVAIVRDNRDSDERLTREALERDELREGWKTLGAVAASDARGDEQSNPGSAAPTPVQVTVNPPPAATNAPPNVVIVNVPAAPAQAANAPSTASPLAAQTANGTNAALPSVVGGGVPLAAGNSGGSLPNTGATPAAVTSSVPVPSGAVPASAPPTPAQSFQNAAMSFAGQSIPCGQNTCNAGTVCCNASCGTCAAPGASCDTAQCDNAITYPTSQMCGMTTCNVGTVCCNPNCGICAAPGASCPQTC